MLFSPVILAGTFETLLRQIFASDSSRPQPALQLSPTFYLLFVMVALALVANGVFWWKRAN
ncbi:MAG: hypothetical protein WBB01_24265, partial [Phormidesmis sp.]